MLLAIDVGNTRIKAAVFEDNTFLESVIFQNDELQKNIETILNTYPKVTDLIVSSVGGVDKELFLSWNKRISIHFVTHQTSFPYHNVYATPLTLGIDRMVLSAGAVFQFPNKNRLIIDAGTCITYDFVDEKNNYLGGAISPGIRLRYESLHSFTANLPLFTIQNLAEAENQNLKLGLIGNSTQQSIHSGVINGVVNEIEGFITQYQTQYSNFIIILTGGDTEFLAKRLKNTIFANSNFLLESLNQIFQYKIKND